jgi:hypothetical protein
MSMMYDTSDVDDFDWGSLSNTKKVNNGATREWVSTAEYAYKFKTPGIPIYLRKEPTELEKKDREIRDLKKRIEILEKQVSDYGWERDARNGNIQGMW